MISVFNLFLNSMCLSIEISFSFIQQIFIKPILDNSILSVDLTKRIFSNSEELSRFHKVFLMFDFLSSFLLFSYCFVKQRNEVGKRNWKCFHKNCLNLRFSIVILLFSCSLNGWSCTWFIVAMRTNREKLSLRQRRNPHLMNFLRYFVIIYFSTLLVDSFFRLHILIHLFVLSKLKTCW